MRLNSYVSGLGDDGTANWDFSNITAADIQAINENVDNAYEVPSITYNSPSVSNSVASSSWTNLLQNIINTGVSTGAKIAATQNAVPQLAPGTTYSYNAKTGSYVMTAASPGTASVISTSGSSILTSPIILLALAGLGIVLLVKSR